MIAAAVFAAIVAGCGSSSSAGDQTYSVEADTTMTTANIGKAQFISRVNKICRQAWRIIISNFAEYSDTQDPKLSKKARFAEGLHLSLLAGIDFHIFDNIYRLGAPPGEEREAERIIGALQSADERGRKYLVPLATVDQAVELFGEYNQRARRYGLTDCLVDHTHVDQIET
jgi:hypothetical protein